MRKMMLASAAALAMCSIPAALTAQETVDPGMETDVPATGAETAAPGTPPPAGASATDMAQTDKPAMTPEQQTAYDAWTPERRTDYDSWPAEHQVYYWTLAPDRQEGYWALTADQRGQIYQMTPQQQELAWQSVVQQLNGQKPATPMGQANPPGTGMPTTGVPDPQMAAQSARPAMPADESYQGGPYKGALTPPPATAMNKEYPVCSKTVKDNCRNPGGV